jgi:hypothetical protein
VPLPSFKRAEGKVADGINGAGDEGAYHALLSGFFTRLGCVIAKITDIKPR